MLKDASLPPFAATMVFDKIYGEWGVLYGYDVNDLRYTLPGGSLKPNEPPQRAARRELREEVDLHLKRGKILRPATDQPCPVNTPEGTINMYLFYCFLSETNGTYREAEPDKHLHWDFRPLTIFHKLVLHRHFPIELLSGWWYAAIHSPDPYHVPSPKEKRWVPAAVTLPDWPW